MSEELPISLNSARKATNWLMTYFGGSIRASTDGTPFSPALLCGIVCQETAYFWFPLVAKAGSTITPDEVVARCVLDASGDVAGTSRRAFPRNTAAFYDRCGRAFGELLVEEANATRALRGMGPKHWVYKGYGIFQYDLQAVIEDEAYFRFKQWYDFEICLSRVLRELAGKYRSNGGNLWEAVRAYNGGGQAARDYRDNVKQFTPAAQAEIDAMSAPRTRGKSRPKKVAKKSKRPRPSAVLLVTRSRSTLGRGRRRRSRSRRATKQRMRGGELPGAKPNFSQKDLAAKLSPFAVDRVKHPFIVVGIRGYYRDTMGAPGVNDRGIYDDALFIDSPDTFATFNGNTDPSRFRPGEGFDDDTKGIASLDPGAWYVHRFDIHNGKYLALCQRAGKVTVTRDGKRENYKDTGEFGINIHCGSYHGTSSLGCQTLHPDQWGSFIALATDLARRYHGDKWKKVVIPYVLIENA